MTIFEVDASTALRSYRIRGGNKSDITGCVIFLAIAAVPLVWSAVSYGSFILKRLSPTTDDQLSWVLWALSQICFVTAVMIWSAFALGWLLVALLLVVGVSLPGYTVWRIDGAGLSSISGVGPFTRMRSKYVPFEAIAKIQLYKNQVLLHVWRAGVARFDQTIAEDLTEADAQRLAGMLTEDLAAAAREWETQGLRINRQAVNYGP